MTFYRHTNEPIGSVVAGLAPREGDNILAVGGSGDQAFALLSCGARVSVVDTNPDQIDYIKQRIGSLHNRKYEEEMLIKPSEPRPSHKWYYEYDYLKYVMQSRNDEFFLDSERRTRIEKRLDRIRVLEPMSVFDPRIDYSDFNKFYLSNVFKWDDGKIENPLEVLSTFSERIPRSSLVYLYNLEIALSWRVDLGLNYERIEAVENTSLEVPFPLVLEKKRSIRRNLHSFFTN